MEPAKQFHFRMKYCRNSFMLHDCLFQEVVYRIARDCHYRIDPVIMSKKHTDIQKGKAIGSDFPMVLQATSFLT